MIGSIIGAVGAIGSQIYGAIKSGQANRKALEERQKQAADNEAWYNRKMSEDYTSRSDVQNILSKQKDLLQDHLKSVRATNAVAGGTDESAAIAKQQALNSIAETTAQLGSNAAAAKDAAEEQYLQTKANISQQAQADYRNQASQVAAAAGQASNAFNQLGKIVPKGNEYMPSAKQEK